MNYQDENAGVLLIDKVPGLPSSWDTDRTLGTSLELLQVHPAAGTVRMKAGVSLGNASVSARSGDVRGLSFPNYSI